ncbi:MAG: hypothetical protein ACOY30_01130 [Bacillota bacterium]
MSGEEARFAGMEETLFELLKAGGAGNIEQGNLLILLSLVNLMGIINIISYRAGIKNFPLEMNYDQKDGEGRPEESAEKPGMRGLAVDPAALLSILGGKGGPNPGQLAGLLSHLMGPPSGQAQGKASEEAGEDPDPIERSKPK